MAYSLRLPDALDVAARAKADYLGISLNALLCVALDAYLTRPPAPSPPEPAKLTRKEKQALYEKEKAARKKLFSPR
jgi:hypothetical protein